MTPSPRKSGGPEAALLFIRAHGVHRVFLLTTIAQGYVARLGFEPGDRADVPAAVQASTDFKSACPVSARVMMRGLV